MGERHSSPWYCVDRDCGGEIGYIIAGELHLADTVNPSELKTSGNSLITQCPKCGKEKTWYSSSPIVRALEQLLDATSYVVAKRAVKTVQRELEHVIDSEALVKAIVESMKEEK